MSSRLETYIPQFLRNLFAREAQKLARVRIPDGNVLDEKGNPVTVPAAFTAGDDYVVLRLSEMFLKHTRVLWREFYPVVHAFVAYGDPASPKTAATVAGPGQLKELDTTNLDRLINLSHRLAGPIVYDGQDLEVLAGLYAVPGADSARALIETVSQLSGVIPVLSGVDKVAEVFATGTERLLNIKGTTLAIGLREAFRPPGAGEGVAARPGFIAVVNAPAAEIEPIAKELWVRGGRLYRGANPMSAQPYEGRDYMLLELHQGPPRAPIFATLPRLAPHVTAFNDAFRQVTDVSALKQRLAQLFREFEADVDTSAELTRKDKSAIRAMVADDLRTRVVAIESGGLFERKSADGTGAPIDPRGFSPRDIVLPKNLESLGHRPSGVALF